MTPFAEKLRKAFIIFSLIFLSQFLYSCTSIPVEFEADVNVTGFSIPSPNIQSVSYDSESETFSFVWTMDSDYAGAVSYYEILAQPVGSVSYVVYETEIVTRNTTVTHHSTIPLTEGVGTYNFRVRAVDIYLQNGAASDVMPASYDSYYPYLSQFGQLGSGSDGDMYYPHGIAVNSSGSIFVSDTQNHRILEFDSSGTYAGSVGSQGDGTCEFYGPMGLDFDSNDTLYVADANNDRIVSFTPGSCVSTFETYEHSFNFPVDVALDSDDYLYIADMNNNSIHIKDSGNNWTSFGSSGVGNGQFRGPAAVEVAESSVKTVIVLDKGNDRIQLLDTDGHFETAFGSSGNDDGEFSSPSGLALGTSATHFYFVADSNNHRVQVFDSSRNFVSSWGLEGTDNGEYNIPSALYYDNGTLYVVDTFNHRVQVLEQN